jgi:hypothetical protein
MRTWLRLGWWVAGLVLGAMLPVWVGAQEHNDPLNERQADQVRELGDRPNDRIKLYLKFVEERVSAIRDLSMDSHDNSRPTDLRAKLEEFTRLTDELADNIETYTSAHADVRKALKAVLEASGKWPDVLHKPPPDGIYDFARKTALDAALSSTEETRKLLAKQETYFAAHKDEAGKNGKAPSSPDPK